MFDNLANDIFRVVVVPIGLTFLAGLIQLITSLTRGLAEGPKKYKVWVKDSTRNNEIRGMPSQSIEDIRRLSQRRTIEIIEIEPMANLHIISFSNLGIDLTIGAIAVDISELFTSSSEQIEIAYVISFHLFLLIAVIFFSMLNQLASPDNNRGKQMYAIIAITLGVVAIILSFAIAR